MIFSGFAAFAEGHTATEEHGKEKLDIKEIIFGHIGDQYDWHVLDYTGSDGQKHPVSMPLPVIVYHPEKGISAFMSSKLEHGHAAYEGYQLVTDDYIKHHAAHVSAEELKALEAQKGKIIAVDGAAIKDFSITKNVFSMFLSIAILLLIMLSVAKSYKKKGAMQAPSGLQNAIEPLIIFVRDEVARPNLGSKYMRFMPLLLTVFFFIWVNNLLGLIPSGANFTGNIAVTAALALVSFIVILFSANKHFWGHLFNPPGVPFPANILLTIIEIISLFIKPIALTIRLFANILAGHIIILSVVSMIFIFGAMNEAAGWGFAPISIAFSIFMFCLELLVAAIQAFIFTNLTAVFIGQAVEEHGHDAHHDGIDHAHHENELVL
ncbi:MAG: ATP synthase F0 subunit A [Bacteroidetes bacterium 43-16]|nr:MAG: ATP synthase F0 subunit A [Bacteroidetes bacterium 43-16]